MHTNIDVEAERKLFEAALKKQCVPLAIPNLRLTANGNYSGAWEQANWEIWQDRAALSQPKQEPVAIKAFADHLVRHVCEMELSESDLDDVIVVTPDDLRNAVIVEMQEFQLYAAPPATAQAVSHDPAAASRLRSLCRTLNLESAVPADDTTLMACQFAVFGQMRRMIEKLTAVAAGYTNLAQPTPLTDSHIAMLARSNNMHTLGYSCEPEAYCLKFARDIEKEHGIAATKEPK